ncbi:substrate-binding periplasmic protein [Marinobacter bohaiensis]|uniref:substrate-binding periplasmic protein n=1 Tax=Marinobacter bohaiensis TaxID=2201898 RepID=UPI000DAEC633|nr:transporter substrate-binding domain-containing protein [Marinobacter bohaiensis]
MALIRCFQLLMLLGTLLFQATLAPAALQGVKTLRFASIPDNPLDEVGVLLIRTIYDQLDIEVEILDIPPARALTLLRQGHLDGSLARPEGFETRVDVAVPVPVRLSQVQVVGFARADRLARLQTASTMPLRVGLLLGLPPHMNTAAHLHPVEAHTSRQLMAMADKARVDLALDVDVVGAHVIREDHLANLRIVTTPLRRIDVYHFLHQRHEALVPQVARVMTELQEDGTLERMHQAFRERLDMDTITLPKEDLLSARQLQLDLMAESAE